MVCSLYLYSVSASNAVVRLKPDTASHVWTIIGQHALDDARETAKNSPRSRRSTCSMCHQQVRLSQSVAMSGRRLCFGCAAAWFDDEEESEG